MKALHRQLKDKSVKTRQGCFSLLTALVTVLPGALDEHVGAIVPGMLYCLKLVVCACMCVWVGGGGAVCVCVCVFVRACVGMCVIYLNVIASIYAYNYNHLLTTFRPFTSHAVTRPPPPT